MDAMVGHRTEYAVQAGILLFDLRTVVYVNRCAVAFGKRFGGRKINGSLDVADMLLEKGVAVVPGIAFGDDECVRLSYAISKEDIAEGLNRIESFVKEVF